LINWNLKNVRAFADLVTYMCGQSDKKGVITRKNLTIFLKLEIFFEHDTHQTFSSLMWKFMEILLTFAELLQLTEIDIQINNQTLVFSTYKSLFVRTGYIYFNIVWLFYDLSITVYILVCKSWRLSWQIPPKYILIG